MIVVLIGLPLIGIQIFQIQYFWEYIYIYNIYISIIFLLFFKQISLTSVYLGLALSQNPGYLKLRKIRAAQNISRTVIAKKILFLIINYHRIIQ